MTLRSAFFWVPLVFWTLTLGVVASSVSAQAPMKTERLFEAVQSNDLSAVKELLDWGADIEARDPSGKTPLMAAAYYSKSPEIASSLIEHGADIKARDPIGRTPLMFAAGVSPTPEIVSLLLDAGAEVNAKNNKDWTPLIFAARFSKTPEIVSLLLEKGANIEVREKRYGRTPMHFAVEWANPETVTLLLEKGAQIEAQDNGGNTPLMVVARASGPLHRMAPLDSGKTHEQIVTVLIERGAEVNARNHVGMTPLMYAASRSYSTGIISLLLKKGAEINARTDLSSVLADAIAEDVDGKMVSYYENLQDRWSPLMFAAEKSPNPEIISLLLDKGADALAKNNAGKKAIDYAKKNEKLQGSEAYQKLRDRSFE